MGECTHDCGSCSENCSSRIKFEEPHELSKIKKVIGVVSGKGGVGKSLVTTLLALGVIKRGKTAGILDADITGPSIPKAFGIKGILDGDNLGMYPKVSNLGIKVVSTNLVLEKENEPVLWRGPILAGVVQQFWQETIWGDVDYLFVDMPPGTGDVPLTVFQTIKLDGIVIVTSPQELVSMIVEKAVNMANQMNVKIYGVVENMSYLKCPDCGKEIDIFGTSKVDEVATDFDLKVLGRLPIERKIAQAVDAGNVESLIDEDYLSTAFVELEK